MVPVFKKILIISSEFPPNVGGIGNHAFNLAKALANEGLEVTVVADTIDVRDDELEIFTSALSFQVRWVRRRKVVLNTYVTRVLTALLQAGTADKIICSGKFSLWTAILLRVKFPRKDLTAVVHGTELDLQSKVFSRLTSYSLTKFNKIISVSQYTKQFLPPSLPARIKQFIIHNGINNNEFVGVNSTALSGEPALVTVGNVTDRKGQENVVNALPEILIEYPSAMYHIIGKPTNREHIKKRAEALNVANHIHFYGAVSRKDLLTNVAGASIKLMLSNHTAEGDFEGFGIAVLEANAVGVPAIGSKDCGIADAIQHGKTGLLVDQYNATEIANAVKTIISEYSFFSNNAKEWAVQHDWHIIVKKYIAALNG